jgi:hypothetical protein
MNESAAIQEEREEVSVRCFHHRGFEFRGVLI